MRFIIIIITIIIIIIIIIVIIYLLFIYLFIYFGLDTLHTLSGRKTSTVTESICVFVHFIDKFRFLGRK